MPTITVPGRAAAGAAAVALAIAAVAGCAAYNGNGDSVTPNGVISEPAQPSPDADG